LGWFGGCVKGEGEEEGRIGIYIYISTNEEKNEPRFTVEWGKVESLL
jgi:hypothetical protein